MSRKKIILLLFLILCIGGILRIYKLGAASLWFDEAFILFQPKTLGSLLKLHYSMPPVYVIFMGILEKLNNSELFLRLPSVLFALATIICLYFAGKYFFGKREGLLSAFLLTIAPFHIYYSQEANKYALAGLLGILSVYFFYKALETSKFSFWAAHIIFTFLSIFTQYVFLLVLFSQYLFVASQFKKYKKVIRECLIAQSLLFLLLLPWLKFIFFQMKSDFINGLFSWSGPVNFKILASVLGYLYFGYNTNLLVLILGTVLFSYLFFRAVFIHRHSKPMLYLASLAIFPILITWIVSHYSAMFIYRYFIVSVLLSYIIIACGILSLRRRLTKLLLLVLIISISIYSLNNYYAAAFPLGINSRLGISARQDFRSLCCFLADNFRKGDIICHNSVYTIPSLDYYLLSQPPSLEKCEIKEVLTTEIKQRRYLEFTKQGEAVLYLVDKQHLPDLVILKPSFHKGLSLQSVKFNRIWVVSHYQYEEKEIIAWLESNYKKDKEIDFHNLKLFLYLNPKRI